MSWVLWGCHGVVITQSVVTRSVMTFDMTCIMEYYNVGTFIASHDVRFVIGF